MFRPSWRIILASGFASALLTSAGAGRASEQSANFDTRPVAEPTLVAELQGVFWPFSQSAWLDRFVAGVEQTDRRGDVATAERQITEAGEIAMLASIFTDYLRYPALAQMVQSPRVQTDSVDETTIPVPTESESGAPDRNSAAPATAELESALEQERRQTETLRQNLASAQDEILSLQTRLDQEAAAALGREAVHEERLRGERERAEAATRDFDDLRARLREIEDRQRAEAASLQGRITELRAALDESQLLYEAALQDLTNARDKTDLQQANGGAPVELPPVGLRIPDWTRSVSGAGDSQTLQALSVPSMSFAARPLFAPEAFAVQSGSPAPVSTAPPPQATPDSTPAFRSAALPLPASDNWPVARALVLLQAGDVSGARLLLERAAETSHPHGTFLLAETYDPRILLDRGVRGIRGDPERARELYTRALALGIGESAARLKALR